MKRTVGHAPAGEWKERYINDVVRRLPAAQRDDIRQELEGLVEDLLQEQEDPAAPEAMETVLYGLGRPADLAAGYLGGGRHLIGPAYYDLYRTILKIVAGVVAIAITVAIVASSMADGGTDPLGMGLRLLSALFQAELQVFAWVTVGFAIAEYYEGSQGAGRSEPDTWSLADLPELPKGGTAIKRSEPIVGIVFLLLVLMLFHFAPQLIGVYYSGSGEAADAGGWIRETLFSLDRLRAVLPFLDLAIAFGILKEALCLLAGRYTVALAAAVTACNAFGIGLLLWIFADPTLWNPAAEAVLPFLGLLQKFFAAVLLLVFLLDSGGAWVRALRGR